MTASSNAYSADAEPPRLLVVDDDPDVAAALRRCLERRGYQVDLASDSASAREAASNNDYDLLVTDYEFGPETALDVIAAVTAAAPRLAAKIVIYSARMFDANEILAAAAVGRVIVSKTESLDRVEHVIRSCIAPR